MKRKPVEKKRHVVAWINKAEWDQVLEYLYSKDCAMQKYALHRITAWKGRFGQNTPIAVESTADLVRCQILDASGGLEADDLVLLYGTALVRFVNAMTERLQKKAAQSMRRLASRLRIPEWIVDLRHEITHRKLPSLKWCRKGCKVVLDWLQQEYWSRQLDSGLNENWDSQSEDDDVEEELQRQENELKARQREFECYKKARELLISYEVEQFQTFEGFSEADKQKSVWPSPTEDLSWVLQQIKLFVIESSETLIDVLMEDGFLVPTIEQLETFDVDPSDGDPTTPCLPRVFVRFWLPLLKMLNSPLLIHLFLEKLFAELQQLSGEANKHRSFYLAAWVSELLLCNIKESDFQYRHKKSRIFVNRIQLKWQQLLYACLGAPCTASPHLLKLILEDMEPALPMDTQQKLRRLCSIYTQGADRCDPSLEHQPGQPVYTVENLHERLLRSRHRGHTLAEGATANLLRALPERKEDLQEHLNADMLAERARELRGSPWQICTDKVQWKNYPLGKVPGQSDDPSCLMVENYSTMTVFDQQVEIENPSHHNVHAGVSHRAAGDMWTHSEINKLKAGLRLF